MVVFRSASDVAAVRSISASATASTSDLSSCARVMAAPLCARMFAARRSRKTIWRLNRTTVTLVQASSWTGGLPGRRAPVAARLVRAKISAFLIGAALRRRGMRERLRGSCARALGIFYRLNPEHVPGLSRLYCGDGAVLYRRLIDDGSLFPRLFHP